MSKIAYFDCFSGISGDMIIGALLDAGLDFNILRKELNKIHLKNFEIDSEKVVKNNLAATKFKVSSKDEKIYEHLGALNRMVEKSNLEEEIKTNAKKIFLKIAKAEAKIHNQPLEKIHFHEIGVIDTIIDVVGALVGFKLLGIEKIYCSKLNVGSGFVEFSHGKFPVPAPATAEILIGIPIYSTDSDAELVTPTGAAIITTVAKEFGDMPAMKTESIGYGAGTRDLKQPNVLRIFIGYSKASEGEIIYTIETNIDDMNPQIYGYVMEKLLQNGALDVYLTNILMKKNRPAIKLTVLSNTEDKEKLIKIILEETTSLGVRIRQENRTILEREIKAVETPFGKVKVKIAKLNGEIVNTMPEYEDCKRIAKEKNIPLKQVYSEFKNLNY
ncbi:MAG: nickel pincer cofactor biosynthesis protein LarC [bacterium]